MGLYNRVCKNPVAFCHSKKVYLNADDIEVKRCLCKPTADMLDTEVCRRLEMMKGGNAQWLK